jgi:hypothetical protein
MFDPTRECGGCAYGARDFHFISFDFISFDFDLKSLEHLFLSHHSSGIPRGFRGGSAPQRRWLFTSSVHSYLRSILTAEVPGWFYLD